jgi:hypothetical protein
MNQGVRRLVCVFWSWGGFFFGRGSGFEMLEMMMKKEGWVMSMLAKDGRCDVSNHGHN